MDYIFDLFNNTDLNTELSFDAVKVLSLFRSCYEELGWKSSAWLSDAIDTYWREIHSDHDDVRSKPDLPLHANVDFIYLQVRSYIAELLAFSDKIKVCWLRVCVSAWY